MHPKVVQAFRKLYLTKRTGALVSDAGEVKRAVFFKSGFVVGSQSSLKDERFGEVMVRRGRITQQQLADASIFIKSGRKLGAILTELGLLAEAEIEHYLREQFLDVACSLIMDPPRRIAFSPQANVEETVSTPLSVADVIMEAARRAPSIDGYLASLLKDQRPLGFATDPLLRLQNVTLTPEEAFVLSRVDGKERATQILSLSPLPEERTARVLQGLMAAGILEPEGESERPREDPAPKDKDRAPSDSEASEPMQAEISRLFEQFRDLDHWEVLEVARDASQDDLRRAFHEKAFRYHPDRHRQIKNREFHEQLSFVFNRLSEAYRTLSTQSEAQRYQTLAEKETQYEEQRKTWLAPADLSDEGRRSEKTRDARAAQALFAQAKKAFAKKDYWETIQLCRRAVELANDKSEHFHLLAMALAQNPKWRMDAERNFKIAIHLDPWRARYYADLGELYRRAGLHERARRMSEQAKAADPDFQG